MAWPSCVTLPGRSPSRKRFLEGKSYSNADNSIDGVDWPALSFLGETTPATFLECLTPDMMADGFLSRFLCVTYEGQRPPPNRERDATLEDDDLNLWKALVGHMVNYQYPLNMPAACVVQPDEDAQEKLERFELDCIDRLNATEDESERQVWSRAHLKALKVASLLAVADNPIINLSLMIRQKMASPGFVLVDDMRAVLTDDRRHFNFCGHDDLYPFAEWAYREGWRAPILAFKNETVIRHNRAMHARLFPDAPFFGEGEPLLSYETKWMDGAPVLHNGEVVTCESCDPASNPYGVPAYRVTLRTWPTR